MKALIAMSGGVDSSVAALLMSNCERIGCTMRLFDKEDDDNPKSCCSLKEVEDARAVCHRLGIPYYVFNFTERSSANSSIATAAASRPIPVSTATAI